MARAKRELAVESMHELWNDPPSSHNEGAVSGSAEILIVGVPGVGFNAIIHFWLLHKKDALMGGTWVGAIKMFLGAA